MRSSKNYVWIINNILMNVLTLPEVVLNVIEKNDSVKLDVEKMNSVREELAKDNLFCDFSAGAIETFAYDFPKSVVVSEFEITIQYTHEVTIFQEHSANCNKITTIKNRVRNILIDGRH